jgi:Fe-S oxidoreductase
MSTPQEYWDACLIIAWRNFETYRKAMNRFHSIVGKYPDQMDPPLLRLPKFFPSSSGVRLMTYTYMYKINDWLLKHERDRDVDLLKKLKTSKYTVHDPMPENREFVTEKTRFRTKQVRIDFERMKLRGRNRDTDWNVTK